MIDKFVWGLGDLVPANQISRRKSKRARALGGPGSGNHGHAGRPGEVGGSASTNKLVIDAESLLQQAKTDGSTVLFHSGHAAIDADLAGGIEPRFGDWLEEVLSGATDEEGTIDAIREQDPITFFSTDPSWVAMKAARSIDKHVSDITVEEVRQHGQLSIVLVSPREPDAEASEEAWARYDNAREGADPNDFRQVGGQYNEQAVRFGTNRVESYELPFGVEPNDIYSHSTIVPDITLTGDALIEFMQRNYPQHLPKEKRTLGGKGSGNFGHAGRPGEVGGSSDSLTAEKRLARLKKLLPTTTDFRQTAFITPDGTRLTFKSFGKGGFHENEIGKFAYTMNEVLKLGVLRYTDAGIEVGNVLSEAQAQMIVDDFIFAQRPSVAVDIRTDDKGYMLVTTSKVFSIETLTPNVLRTFVNSRVDKTPISYKTLGGKGSGNFGHAGRPGKVGGSSTDGNVVGIESAAFKAWFKDSKVVDEDGKPLVVYHGSTHDIESFLPAGHEKLNAEGDWGSGIYFTNDQEDVSRNYAGEGPDLTSRIEQRAEEIISMKNGDYDEMIDEARKQAHDELVGKAGAVALPVYLSIQEPFIVGREESGTWLGVDVEYSPLSDFQDDEIADMRERNPDYTDDDIRRELSDNNGYEPTQSGKLIDFIAALKSEAGRFNDTDGVYEFIDSLAEHTYEGGIRAEHLDRLWRNHESASYVTDDNGRLVRGELFRRALEKTGFDGIIDHSVTSKFPNMFDDSSAVHYVVFKPTQVKSAIGNRGTYDPKNPLITMAAWQPETLVHVAADKYVVDYTNAVTHGFDVGKTAIKSVALRLAKTLEQVEAAVEPAIKAASVALGQVLPEVTARVVGAGGKASVQMMRRSRARVLGGAGSGNFGHSGRPGEVGGSASGAITVHIGGHDTFVKLPGRYDTTEIGKDVIAVIAEGKGYLLLSNGNIPRTKWVAHVRVQDKFQGQGVATSLYAAGVKAVVQQGGIGIMKGGTKHSSPDRESYKVSDQAQNLWNRFKAEGFTVAMADDDGYVHDVLTRPPVFREQGYKGFKTLADARKIGPFKMEFDFTNPDVLEWAEQHAAELIAGIEKTTRRKIRQHVVDALDSGSLDDLERQLLPLLGDRDRAKLIAHTETMAAANEGQRQSWEQAIKEGYLDEGLTREWIATADEVTCPICRELNGKRTDLHGQYTHGGGDGPPAHPRCRCTEGIVG